MKQPNIVFVGHVVIDRNKVEQTSYVRWGSPAMFMAKYFQSHFGLGPTVIASYGRDFVQYAEGVKLLPAQPNLTQSTVYENIVTDGHRTQYCHHGDATLPKITADIQEALHAADILFLTPLAPTYAVDYVAELMKYISPDCLKVLSPQGYMRHINADDLVQPREFAEAVDILPHFDVVVLSDEDHPRAETRAHEWKRSSPTTEILVTLNARGADIIQPEGVHHIPTTPVPPEQIIDSVGCGDIFTAALAYSMYQGNTLATAIQSAHAATREKLLDSKHTPSPSFSAAGSTHNRSR